MSRILGSQSEHLQFAQADSPYICILEKLSAKKIFESDLTFEKKMLTQALGDSDICLIIVPKQPCCL